MKKHFINPGPLKRLARRGLAVAGVLLLALGAARVCGATWSHLGKGLIGGAQFFVRIVKPDPSAFVELLQPALESVFIALVGTVLGTAVSLVFALMAAANIAPGWVRQTVRFLLVVERALPEIVILLFLVAAFGLGPFAGVLSLAIGSIGMLGKLMADAIEELDPVTIESIQAIGATRVQVIVFGVIQPIMPSIISFALFRFEWSIRLSVILGAVGAGGIGLEMYRDFTLLYYERAASSLILILAMIFLTEQFSGWLRKKIKAEGVFR